MSEMIERVARALCIAAKDDPDKRWRLCAGKRDILGWQEYEEDARAAIKEMRTPTFGMIEAMDFLHKNEALKTWQKVIDEALRAPSLTSHKGDTP